MLKKLLSKFIRHNKSEGDVKFDVSGLTLLLPAGHDLPKFKSKFPLYDAFLGHLVTFIPEGQLVIDVGANVGDTLFAMAGRNSQLTYLCIEADDFFASYLSKNVKSLMEMKPRLKVKQVNCLVAKDIKASGLSHGDRTKNIVEATTGDGIIPSRTLSDIYKSEFANNEIGLIKVDVDGYDYDVVNSAIDILKNTDSYVYFECDVQNEQNLEGYVSALENLVNAEYLNFVVFDNYGAPLIKHARADSVIEIIKYTLGQNQNRFNRTFFYIDVLAYTASKKFDVENILATYTAN